MQSKRPRIHADKRGSEFENITLAGGLDSLLFLIRVDLR